MFREQTLDVLQKQYLYTNLSDLLTRKANVWDVRLGNFAETFINEVLNFDTCTTEALDNYWGKMLKLSRTFIVNGETIVLTDKQYREVLKIRAFSTRWQGDIESINVFMNDIFKERGTVYVVDPQTMTSLVYNFLFKLEDWEIKLFVNADILPRIASIDTEVHEIDYNTIFGFNGTELKPFNEGIFWPGKIIG